MGQVLCIPIYCGCGARAVWAADVQWLARQGLNVAACAPSRLASKALTLPRDAADVTGKPSARCPRCFGHLPVVSLMRSRLAAGVGLLLDAPSEQGAPAPRQPSGEAPKIPEKGARLNGQDGRRAPRIRGESELRARASVAFDLTVVDISILGLLAEHHHDIQAGTECTLHLRLPSSPETLRVPARAVWTMSHRIGDTRGTRQTTFRSGFEFLNLELQVATALQAYVAECLTREGTRRP